MLYIVMRSTHNLYVDCKLFPLEFRCILIYVTRLFSGI